MQKYSDSGFLPLNYTLENIEIAAEAFLNYMESNRVFAFEGDMGAGKTTLIAEICKKLGADDDFGSPTFSIINEYCDKFGNPIYHFDFYRINSPEEALEIGVDDYFYSGDPCMIEWPDKIGNLLPQDAVTVKITVNPDDSRTLEFLK